MSDLIDRQAAIDAIDKRFDDVPMELTTEILQLRHDLRERIPSAQPATNCSEIPNKSDTISRQAAIDALEKVAELYPWRVPGDRDSYSQYNEAWQDALNRADSEIKALPSAQQERKTGRWVERNPQNSPVCRLIECSECGNGYIVGYNIDYDDWINGRDFCMRCGADLRGGNNG